MKYIYCAYISRYIKSVTAVYLLRVKLNELNKYICVRNDNGK